MPSIQAKMISGSFKLISVNKMLDKQGAEFDKMLENLQPVTSSSSGPVVPAEFVIVYKVLSKIALISNVSNKISVLEKRIQGG